MASLENRVTSAVLSRMRARRDTPSIPEPDLCFQCSIAAAPVRLREALFSDFDAVTGLKKRWGLIPDSLRNWERLWRYNPALEHRQVKPPMGWVLEVGETVVGYLGNICLRYHHGENVLTAAVGSGFVVEPAYRALSLSLNAAFYRQQSIDLYLTTTAIEVVGKIARAFKCDPLPQADYDTVLFWVLQPYPFSQAVMKKLRLGPTSSYLGGMLASLAIGTDKIVRNRLPRCSTTSFKLKEIGINDIGDNFQALWIKKLKERPRLLADRSTAALRWHFDIPGDRGATCVSCCYEAGELVGYAVIRSDPEGMNGLRRSTIADMLAKEDDPAILRFLWAAAYDHAKYVGSHVLEVLGFPHNIRQVCSRWNPYRRKYPACPFYYKAADPMLHKSLSDGMAWYASSFDGDTALMPLNP